MSKFSDWTAKLQMKNLGSYTVSALLAPFVTISSHSQSAAAVNHSLECPQATFRHKTEIPFHLKFENFLPVASGHKIQTGR